MLYLGERHFLNILSCLCTAGDTLTDCVNSLGFDPVSESIFSLRIVSHISWSTALTSQQILSFFQSKKEIIFFVSIILTNDESS